MTYTSCIMFDAQLRALFEMVAPGSPLYLDAHYLVADVDLDPRRAQRFVPFPLRLASTPTAPSSPDVSSSATRRSWARSPSISRTTRSTQWRRGGGLRSSR